MGLPKYSHLLQLKCMLYQNSVVFYAIVWHRDSLHYVLCTVSYPHNIQS